jgi:hypothetical protein
MDLVNTWCGAEMTLSPVYLFPVMDEGYDVVRTERRLYDDVQSIHLDDDGRPVSEPVDCQPGRATTPRQNG